MDVAGAQDLFGTWVAPALLGLGLAAASGLRIFVPLLMAALAAKFQLFGIELNESMAWVTSNAAIAARLSVSEKAVAKHINSIFAKLDLPLDGDDHRRVRAVLAWLRL